MTEVRSDHGHDPAVALGEPRIEGEPDERIIGLTAPVEVGAEPVADVLLGPDVSGGEVVVAIFGDPPDADDLLGRVSRKARVAVRKSSGQQRRVEVGRAETVDGMTAALAPACNHVDEDADARDDASLEERNSQTRE